MTASTIEMALGGYEPPDGAFSVGCVNHRGQGCTAVYPLEEAALMFDQLKGIDANYLTRAQATAKCLRKYFKRRREQDAKALALAALSTAIASPHRDFASEFSAAVREYNRAAVSVVFGKKRGLLVVVAERGFDDPSMLKHATRAGFGPMTIRKLGEEGAMQ